MTTFNTLIRKSDRKYMKITQGTSIWVTPCSHPTDHLIEDFEKIKKIAYTGIDWSLYDLIEVTVIPTAETCKWTMEKVSAVIPECYPAYKLKSTPLRMTAYIYCPFCGRKIERI